MDEQEENHMIDQEATREALGYGFPEQEEKHNLIAFFKRVIDQAFNAKTANLNNDELGMAKIPVRTNMEIAAYCKHMGMTPWADMFMDDAQIILSTSLSRDGTLIKLPTISQKISQTSLKKQLGETQEKKRGLFGKKD